MKGYATKQGMFVEHKGIVGRVINGSIIWGSFAFRTFKDFHRAVDGVLNGNN